jgi:beta-ureidopropionase / N-carbamoyl-L-amino-acid hydrolase
MFELHIEQGPILETEGKVIGIVQGVQGMRWYDVTVTGTAAHTGSTPMALRKNALIGAARLVEAVDHIARKRPPAVGTVGLLEVQPNSRNVIPGEVFLTIDFRHPKTVTLDEMETELEQAVSQVPQELGLAIHCKRIWDSPPVAFDPDCIACVREGAQAAGFPVRDIISGPGHDAAYISRVAPTTMIFVPCKDGISHNESEWTTFDECAAGAQVLLNAVLAYDRRFAGEPAP